MNNPEQSNPEGKDEFFDEKIVEYNLNMLNTDMNTVLREESIGGNAGTIEVNGKRYSCIAANGFADKTTGEIVAFGNFQNIDKEIVKNNAEFTLKISMFNGDIVDFFGREKMDLLAATHIKKAIERYNLGNKEKSEE